VIQPSFDADLPRLVAGALFIAALLVLSVIDFRVRRLPDRIVLPMLWAGLALNALGLYTTAADAIFGAIAGYGALWLIGAAYSFRQPDSFGHGDMKLAAMMGAWLGASAIPAALLVAFIAGTCACLPLLLWRRLELKHEVPFGPALALGGAAALVIGPAPILGLFAF
jgi:leader peptidase (prepilin peptidase)/N-methyltransferase